MNLHDNQCLVLFEWLPGTVRVIGLFCPLPCDRIERAHVSLVVPLCPATGVLGGPTVALLFMWLLAYLNF